eukprot:scaffold15368_cov45-Phaeocystis_antarctica.AAC.1
MLLACALWVGIGRRSQRGHQRGRSRRSELGLSGWYKLTTRPAQPEALRYGCTTHRTPLRGSQVAVAIYQLSL